MGNVGNALNLQIRPYRDKNRPNWKWRINISAKKTGSGRERKLFKTRQEAEKWLEQFHDNVVHSGVTSALSDSITVEKAWQDFFKVKFPEAGNRQKETLILNGKRICTAFGTQAFEQLGIRQVENWLADSGWSKRTQFNAFSYLYTFAEWCRKRKIISINPVEDIEVSKPRSPKPIMSPLEMRVALHCSKNDIVMRSFICNGGFAGLRTKEQQAMRWGLPDFNFPDEEIWVSPEAIKNTGDAGAQERYVKMIPAYLRNVPDKEKRKGEVIPLTLRVFQNRRSKMALRMFKILKRIGAPKADRWMKIQKNGKMVGRWPQNILRHSFLSHMLAAKKNAWEVAHEGGHRTTKTLYQDYVLPKSDREANAYLNL